VSSGLADGPPQQKESMDSIQKQENIAMQNTIANSGVCRAHFLRRNLVGSSFKKVDGLISKGEDLLKQTMKVEGAKTLAARPLGIGMGSPAARSTSTTCL